MTATIRIGDLRHRVRIERGDRTDDGAGGATLSWSLVAEVAAAIWSRDVNEIFSADRIAGAASHDIWIRHRGDVTPDMRIVFGARVFDILGVIDVEDRGRWSKCPVEERDL